MTNIVMGLVKGYTYEQIRPFIASLRETGYADDVCFFYSELDDSTVQSLREYGVDMVPFKLGTINILIKRIYIYSLLSKLFKGPLGSLHQLYTGVLDRIGSRNGAEFLRKSRIATKTFNVYCVRYPLYYLYLAGKHSKYSNVLLSDVRDVIFQRNPFDVSISKGLCFFLEDARITIKECPYNSSWIRGGFGDETLRDLGNESISCSGVTLGSFEAIMNYLELMVEQMLMLKVHPHGMDQGVHNYLLYKKYFKEFQVFANGFGPVFTMGNTTDLPTQFNAEGLVLNHDGSVAHILHQYDRHLEKGKLQLEEQNGVRLRPNEVR